MADLLFTIIYEKARQKMDITADDYRLCHYVQTWGSHPDNPRPGWCDRTNKQKADWIGITERGIRKMQLRLIGLGLLQNDPLTSHLRITRTWFEIVNDAKREQLEKPILISGEEQSSTHPRTKFHPNDENARNKVPPHNKSNTKSTHKNNNIPDADAPVLDKLKIEPWTKKVATIFDEENEAGHASLKIDFQEFNWKAGGGRQFSAIKQIREAMIPEIEKKQNRKATETDIESGFRFLFKYGFKYLAKIAGAKGGSIQFTPATVLNNYNQILQYARQENNGARKKERSNRSADLHDLLAGAADMDL